MYAPPTTIAPPAPFPLVVAQSSAQEFVAPGVAREEIRLQTSAGPLVIHLIAVDTSEPTVRLGVVLAHDRLVSSGETVSSMAARTGAVAGVNADYFDIGNTNQPLNIVVRDGQLLRSPSNRVAFVVGTDRRVRFENPAFHGSLRYGDAQVPLTGVNIWPPEGGASLMTSAFGPLAPNPAVTAVSILPQIDTPGEYRVTDSIAPGPATGSLLAFGPAAAAIATPPPAGSTVEVTTVLDPPLDEIAQAAGGGPLLVADAQPVVDPNEPAPEEHDIRFPVSGAGLAAPATLLLVAVDGRIADTSVGLTRPEFGSLMRGLGAADAMAFDSGGSATLVARVLGDERSSVVNAPSDGLERPVADGVFVYSDAAYGAGPRLFARPAETLALPNASIPLRGAVVDVAGHVLAVVQLPPLVAAADPGEHSVPIRDGALQATVHYRTVEQVAKLAIEPPRPNPNPGESLGLRARGSDALGNAVALATVRWSVSGGSIMGEGTNAFYRAGSADGLVTANAGGAQDQTDVLVGRHVQALPLFAAENAGAWQFATAPKGAPGTLTFATVDSRPDSSDGVLSLPYDLDAERAAYATGDFALPGEPIDFSIDAFGDESGVALRAGFINRLGERQSLTLANRVDWSGWRRLAIALPPALNPPVHLASLYVVRLHEAPRATAGVIQWRNPAVTLAGSR